jgi:hypothetical protein
VDDNLNSNFATPTGLKNLSLLTPSFHTIICSDLLLSQIPLNSLLSLTSPPFTPFPYFASTHSFPLPRLNSLLYLTFAQFTFFP